jgi:hypothetical protein
MLVYSCDVVNRRVDCDVAWRMSAAASRCEVSPAASQLHCSSASNRYKLSFPRLGVSGTQQLDTGTTEVCPDRAEEGGTLDWIIRLKRRSRPGQDTYNSVAPFCAGMT